MGKRCKKRKKKGGGGAGHPGFVKKDVNRVSCHLYLLQEGDCSLLSLPYLIITDNEMILPSL